MEIGYLTKRFQEVAFDVSTVTPRTQNGNLKVLATGNAFLRYVRAKALPDERAERYRGRL